MSKAPICPSCSIQMVERKNSRTGETFYGCKNFPKCDETAKHEDDDHGDDCDCFICTDNDMEY